MIAAGADMIHFDVMDSHYVPSLTVGPPVLESLRKRYPNLSVDVHLMVRLDSNQIVQDFINAGATYISIHPETSSNPIALLQSIRKAGVKAGIVLNPDEPVELINPYLDDLDLILIMSVFPGRGGQKFIPHSIDRLKQTRSKIDDFNSPIRLEVDGGINLENIGEVAGAGADMFVAGTAVFGSDNYQTTIQAMRAAIGDLP